MNRARITIPKEQIADFCRRNHIRRLSLFGSVLQDDFRPDSDVDVLIEYEPGQTVGFRIFDMEDELAEIVGHRPIDLINQKYLNRHLRDRILAEAEVEYAEG